MSESNLADHGLSYLSGQLDAAWGLLVRAYELLDEAGQEELGRELDGGFAVDERVEILVYGSGRVFPRGLHVRQGTVLKRGQTPFAWMVALDEPIGQERVVSLPSVCIRPLEETSEETSEASADQPSEPSTSG